MRVGFLIDRWQERRGGAERALFALARHLRARGHEVHAFAAAGPAAGEDKVAELHLVRARGWLRTTRELSLARNLITAAEAAGCERTLGVRHLTRVDVLWAHGGCYLATLRSLRANGPMPPAPGALEVLRGRHALFAAFERALVEGGGAGAIVCPSLLAQREYLEFYPSASPRLHLAPNGVELERFHPRERPALRARLRARLGLDTTTPLIVFAAHQPRWKGLPELAQALRGLGRLPWFLLVAGVRHIGRWRRELARTGLGGNRVRVLGQLDACELAAGADVCVLPTWRDTCGMVLLEALAAGTPVVTTRRAGAAEVITNPEQGEVLDSPTDLVRMREALEWVLERVLSGAVDPYRVRAAVLARDHSGWMATMEQLLCAPRRDSPTTALGAQAIL